MAISYGDSDRPDRPPIARKTDPETSKQSAAEYSATNREKHVDTMRNLIARYPDKTAGEYSNLLLAAGFKPLVAVDMPTKRISDLIQAGDVVVTGKRKCKISGRSARTYQIASEVNA